MLVLASCALSLTGTCGARMAVELARRWTPQFLVLESKEVVFPDTQSLSRFSSFITFCSGRDDTHAVVHHTDSGFNLYVVSVDKGGKHTFQASLASCADGATFKADSEEMMKWYTVQVSDKIVTKDSHMQ